MTFVLLYFSATTHAGPTYNKTADLGGGGRAVEQFQSEFGRYRRASAIDQARGSYARSVLRSASTVHADIAYSKTGDLGGGRYGIVQTYGTFGIYALVSVVRWTPEAGLTAVAPIGIESEEAFGTAAIGLSVQPASTGSAEAFGTALVNLHLHQAGGIPSEAAVGEPGTAQGARPPRPPKLRPIRIPGKGAIWFDHIPYASVEPREVVMTSRIQYPGEQMEINLGASGTVFGMGGPQCCGFIVPEYLGADLGIVAYGAVGMGGPRNVLYCR